MCHILQTTSHYQIVYDNGAYWYKTPGYSFGFCENSTIKQDLYADDFNLESYDRSSWNLINNCF